jgi:hypothetical protein
MEIAYTLNESDILALTKYRMQHVPSVRHRLRLRRFGYLIGFTLLAFGVWFLGYGTILGAMFLAFAVTLFLFYPVYLEWTVRRSIHKTYQDAKMQASLAMRTLRVTSEYLEEISSFGEARIKWNVIDNITSTPTHTFVTVVSEPPSLIIPRERISAGNYDEFIVACRNQTRS